MLPCVRFTVKSGVKAPAGKLRARAPLECVGRVWYSTLRNRQTVFHGGGALPCPRALCPACERTVPHPADLRCHHLSDFCSAGVSRAVSPRF